VAEKSKRARESRESIRVEEKRAGTGERPKIVKSGDGWKKEANTEKEIDINAKKPDQRGTNTPSYLPKPQKQPTRPSPKPETTPPAIAKKPEPVKAKKNNYSETKP
jgi:hypothetical protein